MKYPVDSYGKPIKDGDEVGWNYVSFRDDNIRVDHKWRDGQIRFARAIDIAPNGSKSNLTEKQQYQVRSQEFKNWFGDWERKAELDAAIEFVLNHGPIVSLSGKEFQKDETSIIDKVSKYFAELGGVAINRDLGPVKLDRKGVKDSLSHGIGSKKAAAFAAVKDVIEKGKVFARETRWKERLYNSAVITAPISIGKDEFACEVVVKITDDRTAFYLHEVNLKKVISDTIKTPTGGASIGDPARPDKSIISQNFAKSQEEKISKVIDENGEPLKVYRGAEFDPLAQKPGEGVIKPEAYFSPDPEYAKRYKGENGAVRAYYLNIRHPFDIRDPECQKDFARVYPKVKLARGKSGALDWAEHSTVDGEFLKENFGDKYDGIVFDEGSDWAMEGNLPKWRGVSYVPLDGGAQVKSATDNVGSFDLENPDVRFSRPVRVIKAPEGMGEREPGILAASRELSAREELGSAAARRARKLSLSMSELEWLRKKLTGDLGDQVVGRKSSARAKGLALNADVFGLVDRTDLNALKDELKAGWDYVSFRDDNIRVEHKWVDGQIRFSMATRVYNPDARVKIVDGRKEPAFINLTTAELRHYLQDKYQGKEVEITSDNTIVLFTGEGLKSALKKRDTHKRTLHVLDELVRDSHYTRYEPNDGQAKNKSVNGQFVYTTALRLSDGVYGVELKLDLPKSDPDKTYFKGQTVKMKIADAVLSAGPRSVEPLPANTSGASAAETIRLGDIVSTPTCISYSGAKSQGENEKTFRLNDGLKQSNSSSRLDYSSTRLRFYQYL